MRLWIPLLLAGCAVSASPEQVRRTALTRAAFDLGCPESQLNATQLGDRTVIGRSTQTAGVERTVVGVTGCDKKSVYVVECVYSDCNALMNADEKPAQTSP